MKQKVSIMLLAVLFGLLPLGAAAQRQISFDFYGDTITFPVTDASSIPFDDTLSGKTIAAFYDLMNGADYDPVLKTLLAYKQLHNPDDWVYYQLIRRTAQSMSPKADNYYRYTLYKWFLLCKSGYDATVNIIDHKLLFYVQSEDDIYDLPSFTRNGNRYICLNYHDYNYNVDFDKSGLNNTAVSIPGADKKFSYKLTHVPDLRPEQYADKNIEFSYNDVNYHFKIKLSDEVKKMFNNYPVADYQLYFNMPLSNETYNSLIPQLKKNVAGLSIKNGIDYLMHFTRYAFPYKTDKENFGREKRLSPEQTLLYDNSDCEDRAALFYCLVKEIYNVPMIVLAFPHHLTIAVKLDKPAGHPIIFQGSAYSICEPTPQAEDLPIGWLPADLNKVAYEVAYAYDPSVK